MHPRTERHVTCGSAQHSVCLHQVSNTLNLEEDRLSKADFSDRKDFENSSGILDVNKAGLKCSDD